MPATDLPLAVTVPPAGVAALVSRHSPAFRMPPTAHPFHKLVLALSGSGSVETPSARHPFSTGQLVRLDPARTHRFTDDPGAPMTLAVLCLDSAALTAHPALRACWDPLARRTAPAFPTAPLNPYDRADALRHLRRVVHETGAAAPHADAAALAHSVLVLVALARATARAAARPRRHTATDSPGLRAVEASLAYVDAHYRSPLRVDALAARAGVSYRSYTSLFRRLTGRTFVEYLRAKRVAFASRRLMATSDIAASALDAGYSDLAHFYRDFKRLRRTTPARFLASAKRRSGLT